MKTEKLEKQTLTWLVFSANVIVGRWYGKWCCIMDLMLLMAMWHSGFVS